MRSSTTSRTSPSRPLPAPPVRRPTGAPPPRWCARPPGTAVGYLLIDLETGQVLAELNPDLPLIPASTAKLATAVVALDVLGPEHRFRTELLARGALERGVLHGDLILRGGGDPFLDLADLLGLAVRLENSGIREVDGRFLIDDTALPRFSEIEPSQPPEAPTIRASARFRWPSTAFTWRGGAAAGSMPRRCRRSTRRASRRRRRALPPGGVALESSDERAVVWRVADRGPAPPARRAAGQGSRPARRLSVPPACGCPGHLARPAAAWPHARRRIGRGGARERAAALPRAGHAGLQQQHDGRADRAGDRAAPRRCLGRPGCGGRSPARPPDPAHARGRLAAAPRWAICRGSTAPPALTPASSPRSRATAGSARRCRRCWRAAAGRVR